MNVKPILIDFHRELGKLNKHLHGAGFAPSVSSRRLFDFCDMFRSMHFTATRNHDWALVNANQRMVDIHHIFPLMHLDPDDGENYVWGPTDEIMRLCYEAGTKVFFRLGTSIEHTGPAFKFNKVHPADPGKYAEVCAHVMRHYLQGWSNGFHYDIAGWEIWNEPEHECMWDGTYDEFASFFAIMLNRLKKEFPDQMIGGPANCYLETELIPVLKRECDKFNMQPDFYSFHRYGRELSDMMTLPVEGRKFLDSIGWNKTKLILNEWHFLRTWNGVFNNFSEEGYRQGMLGLDGVHGINSAAFNICTVCGWHDTPLDEAYYYGCGDDVWGFRTLYKGLNKNYYSMVMLGNLFSRFTKRVAVEGLSDTQRALAAVSDDGTKGILLIGDFCGPEMQITLDPKTFSYAKITKCLVLDDRRDNVEISVKIEADGLIHLEKSQPGSAAFELFFDLTQKQHSAEIKKRLVAFGDSITRGEEGGTILPEENWLNILGKLLGNSYEVFNAGVGGNSAREAMARYQNDVLLHEPDVILLEFGGNNNDPNKPERRVNDDEFKQHLADFKAGLPKECRVIVITVPPIIDERHLWGQHPFFKKTGVDKSADPQRDIVRKFASDNGYPLLDLYKIIYPDRYECIFEDGAHLNPKGQRVFAEEAYKVISAQQWF